MIIRKSGATGDDWCTLWPDGSWGGCCRKHDDRYASHTISKWQADLELYRCVKRRGHPWMAGTMLAGLTLFGWVNWWRGKPIKGPRRMYLERRMKSRQRKP